MSTKKYGENREHTYMCFIHIIFQYVYKQNKHINNLKIKVLSRLFNLTADQKISSDFGFQRRFQLINLQIQKTEQI